MGLRKLLGLAPKVRYVPEIVRCERRIPSKTLVIHHYCPHTYNAGDHFVIRSIRQHVRKRLPEALFFPKACANNRGWGKPVGLVGENIAFSNRYADAVLIGGSDVYNNWSLRIRKEEIAQLRPPLFLVGLGASSQGLNSSPRLDEPRYRDDIRGVNEVASMSSVRDHATDRFLRDLGVQKHVVTGCPALYLFDRPFRARRAGPILLTFPFPVLKKGRQEEFRALIALQEDLLSRLQARGEQCVVSCHDDRDVLVAQEAFPAAQVFFSNYVDDYFDLYGNAKMVLGSRLHASILAAGMGVPFVNINLDLRGKSFSDTFTLADWNVDHGDAHLQDKLMERYRLVDDGQLQVFESFSTVKAAYRGNFERFMDEMCERISSAHSQDSAATTAPEVL
jgi:hypothetical protein